MQGHPYQHTRMQGFNLLWFTRTVTRAASWPAGLAFRPSNGSHPDGCQSRGPVLPAFPRMQSPTMQRGQLTHSSTGTWDAGWSGNTSYTCADNQHSIDDCAESNLYVSIHVLTISTAFCEPAGPPCRCQNQEDVQQVQKTAMGLQINRKPSNPSAARPAVQTELHLMGS